MPQASSSRTQVRYIPETVLGVTPVTGNPRNLRVTGESLDFAVTKEDSKEIRADRQIGSMVLVSAEATGDLQFENAYAEYDPLVSAVLQSTYSAYGTNGVGTTFAATYTATTITAGAAPTGNSAFTTLQAGQWFRLISANPTDVNFGKLFRVSKTVAPTATVITVDPGTPLTAGTATNAALQTSRLTNGTTQSSFTIEKNFADIGQFLRYRGMVPNKLSMSLSSRSLLTASISFMGTSFTRSTATTLPGTPTPSTTNPIMNASTGVGQLWENGAPLTGTFVKSISMDIDNSLRGNDAVGNLGFADISSGSLMVSGSIEIYFANGNIYDRFLNDIETELVFSMQDELGNGYVVTLPQVNLRSGKINAGARDQDIMASFEFMALSDDANAVAALRRTVFIDRVGSAVLSTF